MPAKNLDLLNFTSLKVEDNLFSSPFQGVQFRLAGLSLSISASLISSLSLSISIGLILFSPLFDSFGLISSLLLSDGKSRGLVVLSSNTGFGFEGWRLGKVIGILQVLICLVKPLVNLTPFPYLGYAYNLDSIASISGK